MSPASLLSKYTKVGRPDALVIPTIYGTMPGHDVVWSAGPGLNGNFIAALYSGPETETTAVQVGINFVTREQLLVLHATELAYDLQRTRVQVAGHEVAAYRYAGKDNIHIDASGRPVAIASVPAENRTLAAASTAEMLDMILSDTAIVQAIRQASKLPEGELQARDYVTFVKSLRKNAENPAPRGDFKKLVHRILAEHGRARVIDTTTAETVSWANPSVLQTYGQAEHDKPEVYVLPTSELTQERWPDKTARDKVLHALGEHFHRHFPQSTR